jgi:hypothetical protein
MGSTWLGVTWHLRGSRRRVVEVERPFGQSRGRRAFSVVAAWVLKQEHIPTRDATRKINNEHSSNATTPIKAKLEDPIKLQAKYNQHGF